MNHLHFKKSILLLAVVAFSFLQETLQAQNVTLETHQNLGQDALRFWYSDPKKPTHVFNQNISPKGDCVQVVNGYVFFTWYKGGMNQRNLMLSRLHIASNEWRHIEFSDKNSLYNGLRDGKDVTGAGNSHRTAAVGVSAIDGTIHLAYDMHAGPLKYRVSDKNIAFAPNDKFKASNFSAKRDYFRSGERISNFTYPSFEVNNEGELIVEYRRGHSRQGDKYIVFYDGNQWSRSQLLIRGNNENPEFNQYGGLSNYFGKMYLGCAVRIKNDDTHFNQGFFFAEAGPRGNEDWKNLKGESFDVPVKGMAKMNKFKVASPLPNGHRGMTAAPKMVVSKNGAVHMTNSVKGTGIVHYYSTPGGTTMQKASGSSPDVSFPGDDGRVYSVGLSGGKIKLQSTPEGKSNWRTDYTWGGSERFGLMEYDYQDGKLYIIASENKNSDKLPLHYIAIDLGLTSTPNQAPTISFKTPNGGDQNVSENYRLTIEAEASDPDGSVEKVGLFIDNELIREERTAPYNWGVIGSQTENELNGLEIGAHQIKIVATDNKGATNEDSFVLTVQSTLSIGDFSKDVFTIFPNPAAAGIFNLEKKKSWKVFSILGTKIKEGNGTKINLSDQANGLYLAIIENQTFKLVKK